MRTLPSLALAFSTGLLLASCTQDGAGDADDANIDSGRTSGAGTGTSGGPSGATGATSGSTGTGGPSFTCPADAAAFDQFVESLRADLQSQGVVGGAVSIVCGGDTVFAAGMGSASTGGAPVTATTRFQLASLTKTFTAVLGARLAQRGALGLDDPASQWVPFVNTSAPYATGFTFAQLLSHTAGYPTEVPGADYSSLEGSFQDNPNVGLWSPPGAVFNYTNDGYALAGLVAQKAGGQSFASLVESEVFGPAGMTGARMNASAVQSEGDYAVGYSTWDGQTYQPTDGYLAAPYYGPMGGAWASVNDMAAFAQLLIKGGGDFLTAESMAALTTPRTPTSWGASRSYGLGLIVDDLDGTPMWSHTGSVAGFLSELTVVPTRGFAIAILVNTDGYFPYVTDQAVERFTGSPLPYPSIDGSFHDEDMADHVGTYQSSALGTVVVSQSGSQMKITHGGQTKTMTPEYRDTYSFPFDEWGPLEAFFWRENGEVKYLVTLAGVGARQ